MTRTDQATIHSTLQSETTHARYRPGGLEPVEFITDDGLHTRLWYYETEDHPLDISKLVAGLTLANTKTTLAQAAELYCFERPATDKGLLPPCAQYQYLQLPNGTRQAPVLTLFGYALEQRDEKGMLLPNTILTFEGLTAFEDCDDLALKDLTLEKPAELSVSLIQVDYKYNRNAIRSTKRISTRWYQDNSARDTQSVSEQVTLGKQAGTHELLRTSPYLKTNAILQRQVLSARTSRLLRETQQDSDGKPITFTCHQYDSLGRGLRSDTYAFDEEAFASGDLSQLTPSNTQNIQYSADGKSTRVRDCDAQGRHQQCYYDGLQRIVRRELQRIPGDDHTAANYCLIEQTSWDSDGLIADQVAFDYLPGGLRINNAKTLPQQAKDWFWQTHGDDEPSTDAQENVSRTSRSALGLFSKGALATHQSTHCNLKAGDVSITHETWDGDETPEADATIKTTQRFNKQGRCEGLTEEIPGYLKKARNWNIAYDGLGRQVSVTRPDKSIVTWAYQGLSEEPVSVSVKQSATAEAKVLASRTQVDTINSTLVRGSDVTQTSKTRPDGWQKPDGTALYQKQDADGSVSWYAQTPGAAGSAKPLVTFELNATTRALQAKRPEQGNYQSLIASESLAPLLLGSWHFRREVRGQKQSEHGLTSLRGVVTGAWNTNGLVTQCWANPQGYRSRMRRGPLEYQYRYTALGQVARITVDHMRNGQRLQVDYAYDACGRETERRFQLNGQDKVRYEQAWSAANQLLSKKLYRDGAQVRTETFVYNTSVTGTSDELQSWTVTAEPGEEVKDADGHSILQECYEYDLLGNLTKCSTKRSETDTVVRTYSYANAENPTRRTTVIFSGAASGSPVTLLYDSNGNLLSNEREQTLAYTESGRLRSVTAKGQTIPLTYYEYDEYDRLIAQYDATNHRRRILSYGANGLNGETWLDDRDKVLKRLVFDDQAGLAVAADNQWLFVLGDPQNGGGDEYQFKDGAWKRQSVSFTPWGETYLDSLNAQHVGLGYNGQRVDPITGCYHLGEGYRLYDPLHKVFYQPDDWSPLGAGGLNDRAYCASGDPVNWYDPSGHIMLNRQGQAATLARLDDLVSSLTPSMEKPQPKGASMGEWQMFAFMTTIGAVAIIASAGTLSGPVIAGLMIVYTAGAVTTAAGMALRQKNPELSAILEPLGQVGMALASAPAIGSQMIGAAKWVMYGSTLAYAGLELARVTLLQSNPNLAEKLGWAAMAASFVDIAFGGARKVGRLFAELSSDTLTALRSLRNHVKLHGAVSLARSSRKSRYLPGSSLSSNSVHPVNTLKDIELGGIRTNGRVMSESIDFPGIHLFEDQIGFRHAIEKNNELMQPFLEGAAKQLNLAKAAHVTPKTQTAYDAALKSTQTALKSLTDEHDLLRAAKNKFYTITEKKFRSVRSASTELDDLLDGNIIPKGSLSNLSAQTAHDFSTHIIAFETKYSDTQFTGVTNIINAAGSRAGARPKGPLNVEYWRNYATDLRDQLRSTKATLETAHNTDLESIAALESNISKKFKHYEEKILLLSRTHDAYQKNLKALNLLNNTKSFIPANMPEHIAPKWRLNVIAHGYAFPGSQAVPQPGRYVPGRRLPVSTSAKKLHAMMIEDFQERMKKSPSALRALTKTPLKLITKKEWDELFKQKYGNIRLISCNLALERNGVSYAMQLKDITGLPVKASTHRLLASIPDSNKLFTQFKKERLLRPAIGSFSNFFNTSLGFKRHTLHIPKLRMPDYYRSPTFANGRWNYPDVGYYYNMPTVFP